MYKEFVIREDLDFIKVRSLFDIKQNIFYNENIN